VSGLPRIGISLDVDETKARYELKRTYVDAVLAAGGLPVLVPFVAPDEADEYLALIDGLVLSGGGFDVPPALYGEEPRPCCGPLVPERTDTELWLLRRALATGMPVLGVFLLGVPNLAALFGGLRWRLFGLLPTGLCLIFGALAARQGLVHGLLPGLLDLTLLLLGLAFAFVPAASPPTKRRAPSKAQGKAKRKGLPKR